MDNTPPGFTAGEVGTEGDTLENQGFLLTSVYHDLVAGNEDLIDTFSDLNDESSVL